MNRAVKIPSFMSWMSLAALAACQPKSPPQDQGATSAAAVATPAAPDSFLVALQTSRGRIVMQVVRDWAPRGADHFYELVNAHYYDGAKFFRVLGFMAQFGIGGNVAMNERWSNASIPDDPVKQSNKRGYVSYAMGGPATRSTQLFINRRDNGRLDAMGFAPIGMVIEGMDAVDKLYPGYGEGAPEGTGPLQDRIEHEGNTYLNRYFPLLDSVVTARVVRVRE
ncbi:MAG TPA: peptidylprolyl isomerase [Gemmatimonadaceae bacterium]|nr:peptidylprolyl isomerase [Gemmatimonadaceae bacterium]